MNIRMNRVRRAIEKIINKEQEEGWDKILPWEMPLLIGKEEVAQFIIVDTERFERKLKISKQREGNSKEVSLESSDATHTWSNALDM